MAILVLISAATNYGMLGLAFMLLFYIAHDHKRVMVGGYVVLVLLNLNQDGLYLYGMTAGAAVETLAYYALSMSFTVALFIPLWLILRYDGQRTHRTGKPQTAIGRFWSKWFFYIFYPGHILVLLAIRYLVYGQLWFF
jgi:hypothetical protein